ncbi:MAG: PAS domain-containing sensor histidine kinase [Planctomycetota bacterium]|jgi:PAS domain S-box-containing protein
MWKIPQRILDSRNDDKMLQCAIRQLKDPEGFLGKIKYLYARRKKRSWDEFEFKDGRVFDRYSSPLLGPGGKYYGRIWYFSDITDCKKAVAKLRESEQKYRNLADNLNALVYRAEPRTLQTTYVNRTVKRFYGYSVKEWLSEPALWENSIYPEDKKRTLKKFREAKRDLKSTIVEYRVLTRNKKVRWVQDYISWDKDKNGKAVSMNGVMYDITASKVAEKELENARDLLDSRVRERTAELEKTNKELRKEITERRQIEEMLRNEKEFSECLIRSSFDGILAFDRNCRYTVWNAGMQRISGVSESEVTGKRAFEVFPFLKKTGEDKFFSETLKGKVVVARDRPYTIPKTGRHGFFEGYYSPLRDKSGKIVGGIAIVHDITERRYAEEQLMAYQKQLRSLASELSLAEERLRRRMAVGLHDLVGQNIAVSKIKLASLRQTASSAEFDKTLSEIERLLTETLQSTISLTFELSPPVLYELGFKAAMEWLVRQTEARHGVPTEFRDDGRRSASRCSDRVQGRRP